MKHTLRMPSPIAVCLPKAPPFLARHSARGDQSFAGAATVQVTIQEAVPHFNPLSVTIHPGDTVEWVWSDQFRHSATSGERTVRPARWRF